MLVLLQLLSLVALLLEELVKSCTTCLGLYTFEFVSCTALLFTLLLLVLLATPLHARVGINCWPIVVSPAVNLRLLSQRTILSVDLCSIAAAI